MNVNESIGGIFRGFVEALVEGSGKLPRKDPPRGGGIADLSTAVHAYKRAYAMPATGHLDRFSLAQLGHRGFVESRTILDETGDGWRMRLRHECGAWCVTFVSSTIFMHVSTEKAIDLLSECMDRIGCYCVRPPEPCTHQSCEART